MGDGYARAAHLYDLFASDDDVAFYAEYVREGTSALDIGAGTGRVALPLAEAGGTVTCIEPSQAMRDVFEEKLAERPELASDIDLRDGTIQSFDVEGEFSLAVAPGCFDHLLDHETRVDALQNVARHLEPGGTFVFDVFVGLMADHPRQQAGRVVHGETEYRRFIEREVQGDTVSLTLTYEVYEDGTRTDVIEQPSTAGICDRRCVHDCLDATELEVTAEYSDYERTPFTDGDEVLIVEATRR